jgi:hypothetical protein
MFRLLMMLMLLAPPAQTGGQFCVRAFEDRNANGILDPGEPLLTQGVSADLLNAENMIIASALLADSPNAAQGVICFQFLPPGEYSLIITSAEYVATTPNTVSATISEGTLPTVTEFGGQLLAVPDTTTAASQPLDLQQDLLPRVVLGALGALLVMAFMTILGAVIYLLFLRARRAAVPPVPVVATPADTNEIKPV